MSLILELKYMWTSDDKKKDKDKYHTKMEIMVNINNEQTLVSQR